MASVERTGKNSFRIRWYSGDAQSAFRISKVTKRQAESIANHIEFLQSSKLTRTAIPGETAVWVSEINVTLRAKLERCGLLEPVEPANSLPTMGDFTASYISSRGDAKPASKTVWNRCRNLLLAHFDADRPMDSFGVGDAKDWRQWMLREGNQKTKGTGLEENTVRKMCSVAAQFFTDAIDRELIVKNPFVHKDIPRTTRENRSRDEFISRDVIQRVIDASPDSEWKLIWALSRYGALRCPSETLSLRWSDVDFAAGTMSVSSPKTEHHPGKESRTVPIFPPLRPYLEAARAEAESDAEFVITRYRSTEANLRSQGHRIIKAAGLKPWAKTFHALRSSRQTELVAEHPINVACAFCGNSALVAMRSYLHVRPEDIQKAIQTDAAG